MVVVGAADGGQEGLPQAQERRSDIGLCDLTMPGLTRLETISRLCAAFPEVAIIALSCHEANGYRQATPAAWAGDFVSKGSLSTDLGPAIRQVSRATRPGKRAE